MIRSDAAVNRRRVLEAADAVLAEQGVAARMDEIARRAGVGVGTLYRHFATKENLYAAVVAARVDLLLEEAGRLRETADPRVAFGTFAARIVADAGRQRPLTDALREAGVDVKAGQADQRAAMHAALSGLLERAQQAGAVRPDVGLPEV